MNSINERQLMLIIALSRTTIVTMLLPCVTSADALQDAWISTLLALGGSLLITIIPTTLLTRFPGKSFAQISREVLGSLLGGICGLLLGLLFIATALIRAQQLALFMNSAVMTRTPPFVLSTVVVVVAAYGAYLGAGALARSAEAIFTLICLSIITGVILTLSSGVADFGGLLPVMSRGFGGIAEGAVVPLYLFAESGLLSASFAKYSTKTEATSRAVGAGILISGSIKLVLTVLAIAVLGPSEARNQLSPVLAIARTVYIMGLLERLDVILVNIWVMGIVFEVAVLVFSATVMLSDALSINPRWFQIGLPVLGLAGLRYVSLSLLDIRKIVSPLPAGLIVLIFSIGLVGLVLGIGLITGRGGNGHDKPTPADEA